MLVHGESSSVDVQGGTVAGGTQGVSVQAGGHLKAENYKTLDVEVIGAEVRGVGSWLSLTDCVLRFSEEEDAVATRVASTGIGRGVYVHHKSRAKLSQVSISCSRVYGVRILDAPPSLNACNVSDCGYRVW